MLDVAALVESPWPDTPGQDGDWEVLAHTAAVSAISRTPFAGWTGGDAPVIELAVRLTSDEEVQALNRQYRHKDKPTNVLSFPMIQPDLLDTVTVNAGDGEVILGDIVLAYGVCTREAAERGVAVRDHAAHLIVHGCLHLLGYDHMGEAEAGAMEAIERDVMAALGLHDPYPISED
ncbi:rRNA maturation RNase YbeY [Sphingomonas sp. SFZ2018-12]|uniref:rRNA maturation RNase YbeY n=1 Tax=Sphingomonas sp. SFZ2018-12 TaxID=2683197 RepID=UPI001F10F9B4|nr:rRNA maturation RNase YbeY [Sphingomonas sp. SFZ2018-12]MCH4893629.1 rRNA maturation RNase YbeY [Sphingomonas sp. SFZ2018-12]